MLMRALVKEHKTPPRTREPMAHFRARAYGWTGVRSSVPASLLRRDAFFTDPWWSRVEPEKDEPEPTGEARAEATRPDGSLVISEETFPLALLDGRKAVHVRRVIKRPSGRRIKEFIMRHEDGSATSIAQLSPVLPLIGVDQFDPDTHPDIIVVEGVAAAAALIGMGFAAAGTLTGGLHTPHPDALKPLTNFKQIYLWPDNDSVGVQHMERVADRLATLGVKDVRVVHWAGGPHRGDAADFQEGKEGVKELMAKAQARKAGSGAAGRGCLALRIRRLPVTLALPAGAQSPDRPLALRNVDAGAAANERPRD